MQVKTVQIPANNDAGYVIVNEEDAGTEAAAKWGGKAPKPAEPAEDGGDTEPSKDELMKLTKQQLLRKAAEAGLELVPDEVTKAQIVEALLAE